MTYHFLQLGARLHGNHNGIGKPVRQTLQEPCQLRVPNRLLHSEGGAAQVSPCPVDFGQRRQAPSGHVQAQPAARGRQFPVTGCAKVHTSRRCATLLGHDVIAGAKNHVAARLQGHHHEPGGAESPGQGLPDEAWNDLPGVDGAAGLPQALHEVGGEGRQAGVHRAVVDEGEEVIPEDGKGSLHRALFLSRERGLHGGEELAQRLPNVAEKTRVQTAKGI